MLELRGANMTEDKTQPRFSVIMPAYNEALNLKANICETLEVMEAFDPAFEIILVDDGSKDRTADVMCELEGHYNKVKKVVISNNQGKGNALREGFRSSRGQLVFFLDADLDLHPRQIQVLYKILQDQNADIVIGSKRHPQTVLNYPVKRRVVSWVYFILVKLLFGLPIKDTQTGIKLFKRPVLEKVFPKILVKKYAFDLELLVLAHYYHYKIAEAPVVVNYHTKFGHIGVKTIFDIWWDTMAVWYRLRLKKYYDKQGN